MGRRRRARETALQVLYELEFNDAGQDAILLRRKTEEAAKPEESAYTDWLVRGVSDRKDEIDGLIQKAARHWRVARMGLIDRNILRLSVYEMLEEKTLVPAIVINEAVDIARSYGGDESAAFVNGVLDAVRKDRFGEAATSSPTEKKNNDRTKKSEHTPEPRGKK